MCQGNPCSSLGSFNYESDCSFYPASGASCTRPASGDGQARWCSSVSDSAVPDNPPSSSNDVSQHNQFASAFANFANLSTIACDTILVDRTGPTIDAGASTGFGPSGTYSWDFDDGATGTGASPSHAYSAPGTYTATVTSADGLGNSSSKDVTVTVTAPPSGPGPGTGTGTGTNPGTGTGTDPGTGTGGGTDPGGTDTGTGGSTDPAGGGSTGGGSNPAGGGESLPTILAPAKATAKVDKKGAFKLPRTTVKCPDGSACKVSGKVASGKRGVGSGSFGLPSGAAKGVALKLTRTGLATLRKRKTLRVTVSLVVTRGTAKATRTLTVTLKPPRR